MLVQLYHLHSGCRKENELKGWLVEQLKGKGGERKKESEGWREAGKGGLPTAYYAPWQRSVLVSHIMMHSPTTSSISEDRLIVRVVYTLLLRNCP